MCLIPLLMLGHIEDDDNLLLLSAILIAQVAEVGTVEIKGSNPADVAI